MAAATIQLVHQSDTSVVKQVWQTRICMDIVHHTTSAGCPEVVPRAKSLTRVVAELNSAYTSLDLADAVTACS